jgi:hypothetical protein
MRPRRILLAVAGLTLAVAAFAAPVSATTSHGSTPAAAASCTDHVYQQSPGASSFTIHIVNTCRFPVQAAALCSPTFHIDSFWAYGLWVYGDGTSIARCTQHATSWLLQWGYLTYTSGTGHYYGLGHR